MKKDKDLFARAKMNVEKRRKEKENRVVEEEYQHLLYNSQKLKADDKTLEKFRKLLKIAENTKILGLGHSYKMHSIKGSLREIIKTRIYHPSDIDKFTKLLKTDEIQ